MPALRGLAVITKANGVTFVAGIVSSSNASLNQSIGVTRDADHKYLKNASGDSVADFITNRKKTVSITTVPYHGTSMASARTSNSAYRLAPGTKVTIADADGIAGAAVSGTAYLLVSSKEGRTNDGFVSIDLELTLRDDNDVTTTPT